jgi:hypothetical protein
VISMLIGTLSLLVISSERYGTKPRQWAYGALGVLLGFWLKT